MVMPVGGALAGLALGCLLAVLLERLPRRGPLCAPRWRRPACRSSPRSRRAGWRARLSPQRRDARPSTPPSAGCAPRSWTSTRGRTSSPSPRPGPGSPTPTSPRPWRSRSPRPATAWCSSRPTGTPTKGGSAVEERGLAQALLYERLNVLDLLQPSVEPLLCLLPDGGFTAQSRELLVADRLRAVLAAAHRGRPPRRHPVAGHRQRRGRGDRRSRRPGPRRRDRGQDPSSRGRAGHDAGAHQRSRPSPALVVGQRGAEPSGASGQPSPTSTPTRRRRRRPRATR